jgi:hypothetical protein
VTRVAAAVVTWAALAVAAPASAQPANDALAGAERVQGAQGRTAGTNAGATREAGEPAHAGVPGGASVWYRWTAPADGQVSFSTAASDLDTVLAVYTGDVPGALTPVAGDDDSGPVGTSEVSFRAVGGTTYAVAVDGFAGKVGWVALAWRRAPANDNFAQAAVLEGRTGRRGVTTAGATKEVAEPPHAGERPDASVWFRWVAPASGAIGFGAERGVVAAYLGDTLATLRPVPTSSPSPQLVVIDATGGTTYWIALSGEAVGGALTWAPPVGNDRFAQARPIAGLRGVVTGTTFPSALEPGERSHGGFEGGASVWFRWRAPRTGRFMFHTARSTFDTILAVYTGPGLRGLRLVAANDDAAGLTSAVTIAAVRGRTYHVVVDGLGGETGRYRLGWRPAR